MKDLIIYWIIPNGCVSIISSKMMSFDPIFRLWIVVPSLIVAQLGKDLVDLLHVGSKRLASQKNK